MKNRKSISIILAILIAGLLGWRFWPSSPKPKSPAVAKPPMVAAIKPPIQAATVSSQSQLSPTPSSSTAGTSTSVPIPIPNLASMPPGTVIPMGQIDSKEAQKTMATFQNAWDAANSKEQNYYGKVIDQHGQPISGVQITGTILLMQGMNSTGHETHITQTDATGLFEFSGLHGWELDVAVKKDGYEIGRWDGDFIAPNKEDISKPNVRAIFVMYKLQGAEPMTHQNFTVMLPCDGTPTNVNLQTGKTVASGGDISITFTRNPVQIDRGKPFEWTLTMKIPDGGGLAEIHDPYPYEAPVDGYQQAITITTGPAPKTYMDSANKTYYYKSTDGKYGRLTISLQADFQPPPTYFRIEAYLNPSGSRNLEFDSTKQVKP